MGEHDGILLDRWETTGDQDAFMELVVRYQGMVYGACLRIVKDPARAEDLVQECFLKLTKKRPRDIQSLGPWLHRIATNSSLRAIETEQRRATREKKYASSLPEIGETDWGEIGDILDEVLDSLPDKERAIIVARFLEGRTQAETAEHLELSRTTVQIRIKKGLETLRQHLKSRGVVVGATVLSTMMTSGLAHAAPPSLVTAMGKAVLSGMFRPATVGNVTMTKVLLACAAGLVLVAGVSTAVLDASGTDGELRGTVIELPVPEPLENPIALAAQVVIEEEPQFQNRQTFVDHTTGEESDHFRIQVVDPSGLPVAGAKIFVYQTEYHRRQTTWGFTARSDAHHRDVGNETDSNGFYEFSALKGRSGGTIVRKVMATYGDELFGLWYHTYVPGIPTSQPDSLLELVAGKRATGRVLVPDGLFPSTVKISVTGFGRHQNDRTFSGGSGRNHVDNPSAWPGMMEVSVDSAGHFKLPVLPLKGQIDLHVSGPGMAEQIKPVYHPGIEQNLSITMKRESVIEGQLLFAGSAEPAAGIKVSSRYPSEWSPALVFSDYTDAQGHYRLTGLGDGGYGVGVDMLERPADYISVASARVRAVYGEVTRATNLFLGPGVIIRGRVINDHSGEPISGVAITGRQVLTGINAVSNTSTTDAFGMFEIRLNEGLTELTASMPLGMLPSGEGSVKKVMIRKEMPNTDGYDFAFTPASDENEPRELITGRVLTPEGDPFQGAWIKGYGTDVAETDADGRYVFHARQENTEIEIGAPGWSVETIHRIDIMRQGSNEMRDIVLVECDEKLTARIVDESGNPMGGVKYQLGTRYQTRAHGTGVTLDDGIVHHDSLADAEVQITIEKEGYIDKHWWGTPQEDVIEIVLKRLS